MRYTLSTLEQHRKDNLYRIYITDSLQNIPQNKHLSKRYYDLVNTKQVDNRSGDEIAADVIKKLGLRIKK